MHRFFALEPAFCAESSRRTGIIGGGECPVRGDDVHIRMASPGDGPVVAVLNAFVHQPHVEAEPSEYKPYDQESASAYFASAVGDRGHLIWLAEIGDRPVGFIDAEVMTREENPFTTTITVLYVHQLAVVPDVRRTGVARALMNVVERECALLGASEVRLEHRKFNVGAHHFYEALGYETYSVRMRKSTT